MPALLDDLERTLASLRIGGIKAVFVDTPPAVSEIISRVSRQPIWS